MLGQSSEQANYFTGNEVHVPIVVVVVSFILHDHLFYPRIRIVGHGLRQQSGNRDQNHNSSEQWYIY
jgi:hypothetical protein